MAEVTDWGVAGGVILLGSTPPSTYEFHLGAWPKSVLVYVFTFLQKKLFFYVQFFFRPLFMEPLPSKESLEGESRRKVLIEGVSQRSLNKLTKEF